MSIADRRYDRWRKKLTRSVQTFWQMVGCALYVCRGRLPLTNGYGHYRNRYVKKVIADTGILNVFSTGTRLPEHFGTRLDERVVEYPWLLCRLGRYRHKGRFLDAGSTLNHEMILEHPVIKNHKWSILTLSPERVCFWNSGISYLYDDLRSIPFKDDWFDGVTCISAIEHIGMDNLLYAREEIYREHCPHDYLFALREMKRVIKPGGSLFITMPFGRYENHGWLQQFDAEMLSALIAEFRPQKLTKTFFRYSCRGWQFAEEEECKELSFSQVIRNKCFETEQPLRFDPDYAAAARGVACIELEK